jgi:hypothetical protein
MGESVTIEERLAFAERLIDMAAVTSAGGNAPMAGS